MVRGPRLDPRAGLAGSLLLALAMALAGCSSAQPQTPAGEGGSGGAGRTGGATGKTGGTSGATGGTSGAAGGTGGAGMGSGGGGGATGGSAGQAAADASSAPSDDGGATKDSGDAGTGTTEDAASPPPTDAPPAVMRPDAMGQACKSAANENFVVTAFDPPQKGVFTAWFSATPSAAPTNSVVGLSDGDPGPGSGNTPLHDLHQILVRFADKSGAIDVRNGATYTADNVVKYQAIQYDFRLVVDVPAKKYAAYVSWKGQPEVTLGTNLAYRDTAPMPTKFDHWGVHAVSSKTTVCGFIARAN